VLGKIAAGAVVVAGTLCLGLAGTLAIRGGEAPIPQGEGVVEGTVAPGPTTPSPVGAPALYGEVRLTDARSDSERTRRRFWSQTFGDPNVEVVTADGPRAVELGPPERWYTLPSEIEEQQADSLAGLPIVGTVDVHERLAPPYILRVAAVRPGDPVLIGPEGRVYLGTRTALEAERRTREAGRWPVVGMFAVIGILSVVGGLRALLGQRPGRT